MTVQSEVATAEKPITRPVYGFIGLGNMGAPMASRVLAADLDLIVYDVRPEATSTLKQMGAVVAGSTREVGERCDIISTVVVDDAQVVDVLVGSNNQGVLGGARPGSVFVIHSTISPESCKSLEQVAAARGVRVLDAPVSGGEMGAKAGTLSVLIGGAADTVALCQPLFDAIGSHSFHMGDVGMGQVAKIVNNHIMLITGQATREGLGLATTAGIDLARMLEVARASTADNFTIRSWDQAQDVIASYPSGPAGLADLAYKDLELALALGHKLGASLPLAALTAQVVTFSLDTF